MARYTPTLVYAGYTPPGYVLHSTTLGIHHSSHTRWLVCTTGTPARRCAVTMLWALSRD